MPEQRIWAFTDLGAFNFLRDQMTLQQAVGVINQLCTVANNQHARITALENKVLSLEQPKSTPLGLPKKGA